MIQKNIAYEASAGSGKTFMLVVRYLSLLFLGAKSSNILTLTFTNKAANEMSERIIAALENLENKDELQLIISLTGLTKEEILQKRQNVLDNFLQSHTKIMTIDSFFAQILRKFSLYVGVMPNFSTVAQIDREKLLERFLLEVEVKQAKKDLIYLYQESKKRLFELFYVLEDFYIKTNELQQFQFQFSSTAELETKALSILQEMESYVCNHPHSSKTAQKAFAINKFEDIFQKGWFGRESLEYRTFAKCYSIELDELLQKLYAVIREWYSIKEQNYFFVLQKLSKYYFLAKRALFVQTNQLSFSDITLFVYELLKKRIDTDFLYFRLDSTIEHILLDEFQDTSIMQYAILEPLITETLSGNGLHKDGTFFFVGDKKQSIYRFRGGFSALFDEVVKRHNTTLQHLLVNYRSQKEIVTFVNDTFRDKIRNYHDQKVRDNADGGYVEVTTQENIMQTAIQKVELLIQKGAYLDDIAILCATNADGKALEEALKAKGYSVVTETTAALINQKEIQALFEYIKYLYFKEDIYKENFYALIQKRPFIEKEDINHVSVIELIKNAIVKYGLYSLELNYFQFIEIIQKYSTIEALLYGYEKIEAEALSLQQSGIKIVTIHKSKGLEYEHVIVIDRLSNPPVQRDTIIYNYDGIVLEGVYLRIKNRAKIDKMYAKVLENNEKLHYEDMLNNYYVAFTRAKRNLFIIQKKEKSSFALLGLKDLTRGVLEVIHKDNSTFACIMEKRYYNGLYYGMQENLLINEIQQNTLAEIHNQNFGLALHYLMQMCKEFNKKSLDNAFLMVISRYGEVLDHVALQAVYQRGLGIISNSQFLSLVSKKKVFKEQPLKYKQKLYIIDLLILEEDSFVIIDYKTGKEKEKEYHTQIQMYLKAVGAITGKKGRGFLCYSLESGVEIEEITL